jgi:hypothetical protein
MLINSISNTYKGNQEVFKLWVEDLKDDKAKAEELEDVLSGIVESIAYATYLTENKGVDIDLLVQIVASYLIGMEQGELDEDTPPPAVMFEESLYPALRNGAIEGEVVKEELPDGEDTDSGDNTETAEGVESEQDSN